MYLKENKKDEENLKKGIIVPFNCSTFGRAGLRAPTSVHDVKLPYIDVVAALGDSLTGKNDSQVFFQNLNDEKSH